MKLLFLIAFFLVALQNGQAFVPTQQQNQAPKATQKAMIIKPQAIFSVRGRQAPALLRLSSSKNDGQNQFDISKPTFDLYTLRSIRGDALVRYNSLNQSEPLRINLYLIAMLSLFSYPALSEAVVDEPATLPGIVASSLGGLFAGYRFIRECSRRSRKLRKMEKELNSQLLKLRLPNNPLADRPFANNAVEVRQVLSRRRILAVCGPKDLLEEAFISVRIFRRRWVQANVLVVPVPTDGSSVQDYDTVDLDEVRSMPYWADTVDTEEWMEYFRSLVGDDEGNKSAENAVIGNQLAWFGLSNSGKSFGSGVGTPRWLEIFGQSLLPLEILDPDDEAVSTDGSKSGMEGSVLMAQQKFYESLTGGSLEGINEVFSDATSPQVQEVLDEGGRLDGWELCLEDGARPAGMTISGSDVLIVSDTEAYSTTIEFPPGIDDPSATLLAVQQWRRSSNDNEWKLQLHQTIPWGPDTRAGGTLRCDCRGCTALASAAAPQYNFRGMID